MGEPIQKLRQQGYAEDYGSIAEQPRAKPKGSLLQAGIEAGGDTHVGYFDQNDGQTAPQAGSRHGGKVHPRTRGCAEQSTLPVPTGERLPE
jgi:hypothetical protein